MACAGTACDLKIDGADKLLKAALGGGLDGLYEVTSCQNGLPMYKRKDSRPNGMETLLVANARLACVLGLF